ncbi:MAG: hypothetical protein QXL54_04020 [Candidatus Bathyarchaeia archaeon]
MNRRAFLLIVSASLILLALTLAHASTSPTYNPNCDVNGDGKIDGKDIGMVCRSFGATGQYNPPTVTVNLSILKTFSYITTIERAQFVLLHQWHLFTFTLFGTMCTTITSINGTIQINALLKYVDQVLVNQTYTINTGQTVYIEQQLAGWHTYTITLKAEKAQANIQVTWKTS